MNQTHLPRSLLIVLFILVVLTFFVGTLRTFSQAYAATFMENPAQEADQPSASGIITTSTLIADFPSPGPTPTPPPTSLLPPPTDEETSMPTPAPTPTPMVTAIPNPGYADTTGIIAMGILLVVVILIGLALGGRSPRTKKEPRK